MNIESLDHCFTLRNGLGMPAFGLGVFQSPEGSVVQQAVLTALIHGYRSIDTASLYGNERGVGVAIRKSGIPRSDIFVTTKVWNTEQGYDSTLQAFERSMSRLNLDYIDLYLIHWPVPGKYKETWRALEYLYEQKKVRAIGVSNFLVHHLEDLFDDCAVKPMVNQVEFHPMLQQPNLQKYCSENSIVLEAWAPIMRGQVFRIFLFKRLGQKYGKTPVQIALRWAMQKGIVVIPKSVRPERIVGNAQVFDFVIDEEDMRAIDKLDRNKRIGPHPDRFNY